MQWQSLGFKADPLNTDPILQDTLSLYTGHAQEIRSCLNVLSGRNVRIVIEGSRGVGTTSFGNLLRFSVQEQKIYLTPRNEIRVEAGWGIETLLAVIVANIVREIELFGVEAITKDQRFCSAKALSSRIAETYRSFGADAFGFGLNYGKAAGAVTQPVVVPSAVLGHHLEDLTKLVQAAGYKNGILLQLNNLDVGEIHEVANLKGLFNSLRDYAQTDGVSWLLVGDVGLRKFIAQQVDRLDDIVSFEVMINPLSAEDFKELIKKREQFYRSSPRVELPIDLDVFLYLYQITQGRLRYIFGLMARLMATLHIGDLTDRVTLEIAKPVLINLTKMRIERHGITLGEELVLRRLVQMREATASTLAKGINKSPQYVGRTLNQLAKIGIIVALQHGTRRLYKPILDATIAYSE